MDVIETLLAIRAKLDLNQTQLAEILGVSYCTVSRWERGILTPTQKTQKKIREFCKEHDIKIEMEESHND